MYKSYYSVTAEIIKETKGNYLIIKQKKYYFNNQKSTDTENKNPYPINVYGKRIDAKNNTNPIYVINSSEESFGSEQYNNILDKMETINYTLLKDKEGNYYLKSIEVA